MNSKSKKQINLRKLISLAMYGVAFIMPLSAVPQILTLYQTQVTVGISLLTWVLYLLFCFVPLIYAIINQIRPLIISNLLWTIVNLLMVIGIIRFGALAGDDSFQKLLLINNIGKTMAGLGLISLSSAAALFGYDLVNTIKIKDRKNEKHKK